MNEILQIMDANINRAGEGLRVVEEIARFVLQNRELTRELKEIRHTLSGLSEKLGVSLLDSRDVERDVGKSIDTDGEIKREGYLGLAKANLKRTQEAMRVIEEFSKLRKQDTGSEFEKLRFRVYTLEKEIFKRLSIINHQSSIRGLYGIIDLELFRQDHLRIAQGLIDGGANLIQLRGKVSKDREFFEVGRVLRQITRESGVLFIVNDRCDFALILDADGVHLGQDDLPYEAARGILGSARVIGLSTHSLAEALEAERLGANYIGFGPIYKTTTKSDLIPVGIEMLREVKERVGLPVIAIGGINVENIREVIEAGADGVACASCFNIENVRQTAQNLSSQFSEWLTG